MIKERNRRKEENFKIDILAALITKKLQNFVNNKLSKSRKRDKFENYYFSSAKKIEIGNFHC